MELIDRLVAYFSPGRAVTRARARMQLDTIEKLRLYDVAKGSNFHRKPTDNRSGDGVMDHARSSLRDFARTLDENHDLAIGTLDVLVNETVGAQGIQIEPMVKTKGGKLNERANNLLRRAFKEWSRRAETSKALPWAELQRQTCRSWLRDGEILIQHIQGRTGFNYSTGIPYALELVEADYLPFDKKSKAPKIVHGIELNTWREALAYHLYKEHPGDTMYYSGYTRDTKRVPADIITHLKFTRRVSQVRGVSILHGVINRLDDLKDYHESERIAARVAAAFTGYIKRSPDMAGADKALSGDRSFEMEPGLIWDDLLPGEEVGTIASNRPAAQFGEFTSDNQRAIASGVGASYSSISKHYDGNYSSQRQELVESRPNYERLGNYYVETFIDPVWRNFIDMVRLTNYIELPKNIDPASLYDMEARGPSMVWINPLTEVQAQREAIDAKLQSRAQAIRDRGDDPTVVNQQIELELEADAAQQPAPANQEPNQETQPAAAAAKG